MAKHHPFRTALLLTALVLLASLSYSARAQTPTLTPREAVVQHIRAYADRHVKSGSPMQTGVILAIFRDNQVGLTPQEITAIYEEEYLRAQEAGKPGPWDWLKPNAGWIVASVLLVLVIFRDALKEGLSKLLRALGGWIYARLAGSRILRGTALRRYRQALINAYSKLHIAFRPGRPLDMGQVFVPLRVRGAASGAETDAYQQIAEHRRLMIVGVPGSGKSTLLKHLALTFAEGRPGPWAKQPIPVLVELHRLGNADLSVEAQLAKAFERNGFPKAQGFVTQALRTGHLVLLFDGLDEVGMADRPGVVQRVKDLLTQYRQCCCLITCRSAVYRGEFEDAVDETLEIVEFSDQQILRFLGSWQKEMEERGRSVERLMHTLQERPPLLALAHNPLLLTMIAYLYTDTEFVLPQSRAEFYQRSTDLLLELLHQEHNRYKAGDKRLVLQQLALYLQCVASERQGEDGRSLDAPTVLKLVQGVLPELNLRADQDARPIVDEIVERSGLLLSFDGGRRYQFVHRALQEFFAASGLIADAVGLLRWFGTDPDAWREVVKLWCGLADDSTALIEEIYKLDPITAFESLSDARKVNPKIAGHILDSLKAKLGATGTHDAVVRAFGAVASDQGPRGTEAFEFLRETLINSAEQVQSDAAANALSLTNVPRAAELLAGLYAERPEIRAPLARMGDLAVPWLARLAKAGSIEAMDDLQAIGTPRSAKALMPLLWCVDGGVADAAAWRLASLLGQQNVEAALRQCSLSQEQRAAAGLQWLWKPFGEPDGSALLVIAGRIGYLIERAEEAPKVLLTLDARLTVPLSAIYAIQEVQLGKLIEEPSPALIEAVAMALEGVPADSVRRHWQVSLLLATTLMLEQSHVAGLSNAQAIFLTQIREHIDISQRWSYMLHTMMPQTQLDLLCCWIRNRVWGEVKYPRPKAPASDGEAAPTEMRPSGRTKSRWTDPALDRFRSLIRRETEREAPLPTFRDWEKLFEPVEYLFRKSWHYRAVVATYVALSLMAAAALVLGLPPSALSRWEGAIWAALILWFVTCCASAVSDTGLFLRTVLKPVQFLVGVVSLFSISPVLDRRESLRTNLRYILETCLLFLAVIVMSLIDLLVPWLVTLLLLRVLAWQYVVLFWASLLAVCGALWWRGENLDRQARNPFHSIHGLPAMAPVVARGLGWHWLSVPVLRRIGHKQGA